VIKLQQSDIEMNKLKSAVIGVGYLGSFHAQKYKNNPHVELVGVFDVFQPQSEKIATQLGVKNFKHLNELIGEVDLVTVAASTQSHFEICEILLNKKIHVNVEKPITAEIVQAEKLIALAKKNNLKLGVGHVERFNPVFTKWRELATQQPTYLEMYRMGPFKARGADVSVLHDLMIHDLDLVLSLGVGELKSFHVEGQRVKTSSCDWVVAHMEFSSGLKCMIKSSRVAPITRREVWVADSNQQWLLNLGNLELEKLTPQNNNEEAFLTEKIQIAKVDALQLETDAFVDAVRGSQPLQVTGEDGLRALVLVEKLLQSCHYV
jgi:predicted dehydrogenase